MEISLLRREASLAQSLMSLVPRVTVVIRLGAAFGGSRGDGLGRANQPGRGNDPLGRCGNPVDHRVGTRLRRANVVVRVVDLVVHFVHASAGCDTCVDRSRSPAARCVLIFGRQGERFR